MKRQSLVLLVAALMAAGAAGCFKDPTSSLANGPKLLALSDAVAFMHKGDSIAVTATLKDSLGNTLPATGATWNSADPTVATARRDTTTIPSNVFTRGFIVAVAPTGGATTITVTTRGVSATIKVTVLPASFPAASINLGTNARLGDTITVSAPSGLAFSTTGAVSQVVIGNTAVASSDTAWVLSRSASTIKAFAKRGGSGVVTVTNVKQLVSGVVVPALSTPTTMAIDSMLSDFPAANTEAAAHAMTIPASGVDTVYGAVNVSTLPNDFWTFTTTASHNLSGTLSWFGTGCPGYGSCPGGPPNDAKETADLDLIACSLGMPCDESVPDLFGYAAASASQPESGSTAAAVPAGQYWLNVIPFTGPYTVVYRLILTVN